MRRSLLLLLLLELIPTALAAQTLPYVYSFTHDRLNTTFYETCIDVAPCVNVGFPGVNQVTFQLSPGAHTIKVLACNANGCVPTGTASGNPISVYICSTLTVSPTTLPTGEVGTVYSQTLFGGGGVAPYTFALTAGSLPASLTLSSAGLISGNPSVAATSNFTARATDTHACTGSRAYSLVIAAAPPPPPPPPPVCPTITVAPTTLPSGQVTQAYSSTILASGGTAPYTFAVTVGTLPTGLTLTSAGFLSGTPSAAGTVGFTVTATDAAACLGTKAYSIVIASAPPPPPTNTRLDWQFPAADSPRFAKTSWTSALGPDNVSGYITMTKGHAIFQTLGAPMTTGTVRLDWFYRVSDTIVKPGSTYDFGMVLLPDTTVSVNNSVGGVMVRRSTNVGATATTVILEVRNGGVTQDLTTVQTRGVWHVLTIISAPATKTSQVYADNVLVATVGWANVAATSISHLGLLSGSKCPLTDLDKITVVAAP